MLPRQRVDCVYLDQATPVRSIGYLSARLTLNGGGAHCSVSCSRIDDAGGGANSMDRRSVSAVEPPDLAFRDSERKLQTANRAISRGAE